MSLGTDTATTAAKAFIVGRLRGTYSNGVEDDLAVAALMAGPTQGRVHGWPVPDEWALPLITFARNGAGRDAGPIGAGSRTAASYITFQVKAVCEGYDDTPIIEAGALINTLLDGQTAIVDLQSIAASLGSYSVECMRESELLTDLPIEDDGTVFQHNGGVYSFFVTRVA